MSLENIKEIITQKELDKISIGEKISIQYVPGYYLGNNEILLGTDLDPQVLIAQELEEKNKYLVLNKFEEIKRNDPRYIKLLEVFK